MKWRGWLMKKFDVFLLAGVMFFGVASTANSEEQKYFRECPECPELVVIPSGEFEMGSPLEEVGRFDSEGPVHKVVVPAFAMGKHNVTVEEFLTFLRETGYQPPPCNLLMGFSWRSPGHGLAYPPGSIESPRLPAVCVNLDDIQAYLFWLNGKVNINTDKSKPKNGPYRLPSEAEWEYAARAGTTAARWWGTEIGVNNANCNGCGSVWDNRTLAEVDTFGPNPFGLYDMLGNVWQWTDDCWNESYQDAPKDGSAWVTGNCRKHVMRGGSWSNLPIFIRSAARFAVDSLRQDLDISTYAGFRVVRIIR